MALPEELDAINYQDVPDLPADQRVQAAWKLLVRDPATNDVWEATPGQMAALFTPEAAQQPVAAPTFVNFDDEANTVTLVAAPGVPLADYRYQIGPEGAFTPVPLTGVIAVGNATGRVIAYSVATATRAQSPVAQSAPFTATASLPIGPAPVFVNFDDATNTVTLKPGAGVTAADYQYKVGSTGTYAAVPADGVITVGNIAGQVFAYLPATAERAASPTVASPVFTVALSEAPTVRFVAPASGSRLVLGATTTLRAAVASASPVVGVEFFAGSVSLGTGTFDGDVYSLGWTPTSGGTANLSAKATTAGGGQATASTFVLLDPAPATAYPTFYGATESSEPASADVLALASATWERAPRTVTVAAAGTYPCFAEPASYGPRPLIQDKNGFAITADMPVRALTLSINGTAVAYNVYTHVNEQYDPSFIFSL